MKEKLEYHIDVYYVKKYNHTYYEHKAYRNKQAKDFDLVRY